jgi:hypothetical protein
MVSDRIAYLERLKAATPDHDDKLRIDLQIHQWRAMEDEQKRLADPTAAGEVRSSLRRY